MARVYPMVSMELDDEEQLDLECPIPISEKAKYPYELRICLTDSSMKKLGLDASEAFVGGIIHLHALARITSVSSNEMESGEKRERVELQIEDMCVESEDEENAEQDRSEDRRRSPLYG